MSQLAIPWVSIGTWPVTGNEALRVVTQALYHGYRGIDTAFAYNNEADVGRALAVSGVPRDSIFIASKFPEELAGKEDAVLIASLDALGVAYLDAWLLHGPSGQAEVNAAVWHHLERAQRNGQARVIGVCNFDWVAVSELLAVAGVRPHINQLPLGWILAHPSQVGLMTKAGIVVQASSPFTSLDMPKVRLSIAAQRLPASFDPYSLVLRAARQLDIPVVVRATADVHAQANITSVSDDIPDDIMQLVRDASRFERESCESR